VSATQPILIPAFNPGAMTGRGNNTYLIAGRESILIDAGTGRPGHVDAVRAALHAAKGPLTDILITHAHPDHASGAAALRCEWPSARFRKFPWAAEDARYGVDFLPLADGERFVAGGDVLEVVHTPGHSPDHCCFWLPHRRILFGGDLMQQGGTVVIPASRGGNMAAYLSSLRRVAGLRPDRVLPAHGEPIAEPRALVESYLAHRQEREHQVVAAMRDGHSTVEAIAARVYPAQPEALMGAARDTVLAHLLKLEHEGRARHAGEAWHIIDP
jgi:glyoxylase-like metal-dependent hydrolase (beta-lactamase superfamily II)